MKMTSTSRKVLNNLTNTMIRQYSNQPTIIVEKIGKIVTFGINRPEKRNCVDTQTAHLLHKAIEDFENDESVYAGVLYGTSGNFCAGFDLKELANNDKESPQIYNENGTMGPTLRFIKKPIVAAISGYAVAGGLELALMCDLRVMEENAILGVYCRRFGVPLIDGGTVRLQAMIGLSRALDMILTGRAVTAKEALEWGLANRVVACGTGLGQAVNLATSLVKFPQDCMLTDRNSVYNAAFNSAYRDLLKYEQDNGLQVIASESIDGAKRFVDGVGRHGKSYNLSERDVKSWEKEFTCKSKL